MAGKRGEAPEQDGGASARRFLALRAANDEREELLHQRGHCSHPLHPKFRSEAFMDVVADALGVRAEWDLRTEEIRAANYDEADEQLAAVEKAQREAELTAGLPQIPGPRR